MVVCSSIFTETEMRFRMASSAWQKNFQGSNLLNYKGECGAALWHERKRRNNQMRKWQGHLQHSIESRKKKKINKSKTLSQFNCNWKPENDKFLQLTTQTYAQWNVHQNILCLRRCSQAQGKGTAWSHLCPGHLNFGSASQDQVWPAIRGAVALPFAVKFYSSFFIDKNTLIIPQIILCQVLFRALFVRKS